MAKTIQHSDTMKAVCYVRYDWCDEVLKGETAR